MAQTVCLQSGMSKCKSIKCHSISKFPMQMKLTKFDITKAD